MALLFELHVVAFQASVDALARGEHDRQLERTTALRTGHASRYVSESERFQTPRLMPSVDRHFRQGDEPKKAQSGLPRKPPPSRNRRA